LAINCKRELQRGGADKCPGPYGDQTNKGKQMKKI